MASPQKENGFTPIANELAEAFARINLSPYESRVVWFVLRKTYGFKGKKMDRISLSQFSQGTGIKPQNARRAIKSLIDRGVLMSTAEKPQCVWYGIQKDYEKWETGNTPLSLQRVSKQRVSVEDQTSLSTDNKPLSIQRDTIDRKIITKDNGAADAAFERVWMLYPKRDGGNSKKNAYAKWAARVHGGVDPAELIAGVERYAAYIKATGKEGSVYVKQTETFLGPGDHWKEEWRVPGHGASQGGFVG